MHWILKQTNHYLCGYKGMPRHYQKSPPNETLIEVYEGSRTLGKRSFLIAFKFKAILPVKIGDYFY